jgi:ABC-type microcin C transport system duplicated ATPase subunit YejF
LELLQRLKKDLDLAMLFITHNAGVLASIAGRIVVMRHGQVVASGTQRELVQMADPYVQEIISPAKVLSSPVPGAIGDQRPLLQVRNLSRQFQQRRIFSRKKFTIRALENIDLTLCAGATVALVGRSGSGKSTLAKCIAGFETPDSGEILLGGVPVQKLTRPSRQQIQLLFQDTATSFNPRFTAEQLISEPLDILESGTKTARQAKALKVMQEVGLDPGAKHRLSAEFSGGQRQRLALARALIVQPKLLILDEALSGLDIPLQANMVRLLLDLQKERNLAYLYISHDLNFVSLFAHKVLVMHQGKIVEQIVPCKIQESTNPETLALLAASQIVHVPA